jgi:hypothetical protein
MADDSVTILEMGGCWSPVGATHEKGCPQLKPALWRAFEDLFDLSNNHCTCAIDPDDRSEEALRKTARKIFGG